MTGSKTLAELEQELLAATELLKEAETATYAAQCSETNATNCVNELQKQIDARVDELRKGAPKCTDWKRKSMVLK